MSILSPHRAPYHAILASALASALGVAAPGAHAAPAVEHTIQCFGVAKAGQNDCATDAHGCAGQAKQSYDKTDFSEISKAACDKLGGRAIAPQ